VHLSVPIAPSGQAPALAAEKVPELLVLDVAVGMAVDAAMTVGAVAMVTEVVLSMMSVGTLVAEKVVVEEGIAE